MPRRRKIDTAALDDLLHSRERIVTHAELIEAGLPLSTICSRIRRGGPWQRAQPGVVLAHSGIATQRERLLAALAYAGEGAILTGLAALRIYGVRAVKARTEIHVLIPHERRRQGRVGLTLQRRVTLPKTRERQGLLLAEPSRCVIDACRELERLDDVREVVAEAVQTGLCAVGALLEALRNAARQRSALPRTVLDEVGAGIRSAAEARVRDVFMRNGIPQPCWNWSLHTLDGEHVVTPDGYWPLIGCVLQIDSMAWHLSPGRYKRTQQLQRALSTYDVPFLPVAPGDVFADESGFVAEVRAFLLRHANHVPTPDLAARPPRAGRATA